MARDGVENAVTRAENGLESGWLGHCLLCLSTIPDYCFHWKKWHSSHESFFVTTTTSKLLRLLLRSFHPSTDQTPKKASRHPIRGHDWSCIQAFHRVSASLPHSNLQRRIGLDVYYSFCHRNAHPQMGNPRWAGLKNHPGLLRTEYWLPD